MIKQCHLAPVETLGKAVCSLIIYSIVDMSTLGRILLPYIKCCNIEKFLYAIM